MEGVNESFDERIHGVAALDHPLTRAVYRLLLDREQLSRDDAAEALDVARSVAAFHLDKLVDVGLAAVRYERLTGRSGPGAGRTAKVYRRSEREIEVSLPERHYDLAGQLLAEAIERAATEGTDIVSALRATAVERGKAAGSTATREAGPRANQTKRRAALLRVLERNGYDPTLRGGEIVLLNCPFHALAQEHRDLVCGMNVDFISGIIEGAATDRLTARLAPEPGRCCVRLRERRGA
jgi:predicted ArsR family transcriptional regulator